MTQEEVQNGCAAAKQVTFSAVKTQLFVEAPKANGAVLFYKAAFGAEEVSRTVHPKRKAEQETPLVLVAELKLGSSVILVSDLVDDSSALVKTVGTGFGMCLETEDVKAAVEKAVTAGAVSEGELLAEGEGEEGRLVAKLKDPYGFVWTVCSPTKKSADVVEA